MRDPDMDNQLRELLPRLHRFAYWLTEDQTDADDLVQTTLERALKKWHTRHTDTALRQWLFAIAYRQFLDDRRRARRYAAIMDIFRGRDRFEQPSVEREVIADSAMQALQRLPEAQRHLLLWVSVEGLSYREVAGLLDVPIGTVMSRLSRARRALRRINDGEAASTPTLRSLK